MALGIRYQLLALRFMWMFRRTGCASSTEPQNQYLHEYCAFRSMPVNVSCRVQFRKSLFVGQWFDHS